MRSDIVHTIANTGEVTHVIALTYSVDLMFLQAIVLPALRKCGHPTFTIFADADKAFEAFGRQGQWVGGIGKRFRIVPVAMEAGFSFHPKAVLLSAQEKATLLVGSGNIGFGGWRENGEVWARFDTDSDGIAPFQAFQNYLRQVLDRVPLNAAIMREIRQAYDPSTRAWAADDATPGLLVGRAGRGESLIDQIVASVGPGEVDRLTVISPFFDNKARMAWELLRRSGARQARLLVQGGKTTLTRKAAASLPPSISVLGVDFRREENHSCFLHAKAYAFESRSSVTVVIGSPNCSVAAMGLDGANGNAELAAVLTMTPEEYSREFLDELEVKDDTPDLADVIEEEGQRPTGPCVRILAARLEGRELHVAYSCPDEVLVEQCEVDGIRTDFKRVGERQLSLLVTHKPHRVRLRGRSGDSEVVSADCWVDHEFELRSSARERILANAISDNVCETRWGAGAWTEVLRVFHRNLQYMPDWDKNGLGRSPGNRDGSQDKPKVYTGEDVFTDDYRLPPAGRLDLPRTEGGRLLGLQQILLRWFGAGWQDDTGRAEGEEAGDAGEDRPVDLPPTCEKDEGRSKTRYELDEAMRKRIGRLVRRISQRMTDPGFLQERHPRQLGMDITLAGILLRAGLSEGWIDNSSFTDATQNIWSVLFFSSGEGEPPGGWIERLHRSSPDSDAFVREMGRTDLSAALLSWALAMPAGGRRPEDALFELACVASAARLPWLWWGGPPEDISRELRQILALSGAMAPNEDRAWDRVRERAGKLRARAAAFGKLENATGGLSLEHVRTEIDRTEVKRGELLWQGSYGICLLAQNCNRSTPGNAEVLCLQSAESRKNFAKSWIVPLFDLLDTESVASNAALSKKERQLIRDFVLELSAGLAAML